MKHQRDWENVVLHITRPIVQAMDIAIISKVVFRGYSAEVRPQLQHHKPTFMYFDPFTFIYWQNTAINMTQACLKHVNVRISQYCCSGVTECLLSPAGRQSFLWVYWTPAASRSSWNDKSVFKLREWCAHLLMWHNIHSFSQDLMVIKVLCCTPRIWSG